MNDSKTKKILIYLIPIIVLLIILSFSYAYWRVSKVQDSTNLLNVLDCLDISLTDVTSAINFQNEFPISNSEGMAREPYIFSIQNMCKYYIKTAITVESLASSTLNSAYVRASLNDTGQFIDNSRILTGFPLQEPPTIPGATSYQLKEIAIGPYAENVYDLRLWIDEAVTLAQGHDKVFNAKIVIIIYPINSEELVDSQINYIETTDSFINPERGWTKQISFVALDTGTVVPSPIVDLVNNISLNRLLVDLGAFGQTVTFPNGKDISVDALNALEQFAIQARQRGVSIIVRFAYSYANAVLGVYEEKEPNMTQILRHIEQLEPWFKRNEDVILVVESGFLGAYGEHHGTTMSSNLSNYPPLLNALLEAVPESRTISVRTPNLFAYYAGVDLHTGLPTYISPPNSPTYRIGLYNDSFAGSVSDGGTFKAIDNTDRFAARSRQISWLKNQIKHAYHGGETSTPSGTTPADMVDEQGVLYYDIERLKKEIFDSHPTYLNQTFSPTIISHWHSTTYQGTIDTMYNGLTAYKYLENHLGYRFVIREAKLSLQTTPGGKFILQGKVENVGSANSVNKKEASLLFVNDFDVKREVKVNIDVRKWESRSNWNQAAQLNNINLTINLPAGLETGKYQVYLKINVIGDNHPNKSIRFANPGVWNGHFSANYMGQVWIAGAGDGTNLTNVFNKTIMRLSSDSLATGVYQEPGSDWRYQGLNPNNYVEFNNELWRIIGVFSDDTHGIAGQRLVKIIRSESIGTRVWDILNANNWPNSTLYTELNGSYYNGITTTDQAKIENVTWKLGGLASSNLTANQAHSAERSTSVYGSLPTSVVAKIGLMYPSDYGFSVLSTSCPRTRVMSNTAGNGYDMSGCYDNSWVYSSSGRQWTLTHRNDEVNSAYMIHTEGRITNHETINSYMARPTLYLKSDVKVIAGNGSISSPYILAQ